MRRIPVSVMRERVADVLAHVALRRERIVLTRHGQDLGALVPLEDLEHLRALDAAGNDATERTLTPYRTSWRKLTDRIHRRH